MGNKIKGNVDPAAPVHSCRIRVGRSIDGFGLSPGITKEQRVGVENLMKKAFANLKVAGMERDWPEGRGIFHNKDKTFLTWVNEEDQLRIISMQKDGDVRAVFDRLARGIKAVGDSVKAESGKDFMLDPKYGYVHSCPTNLGTGMRASVHVDLPGWTKEGLKPLQPVVKSFICSPGAPGVNLVARPVALTISRTSTGWDTLRSSSSRRCLTVSTCSTR